MECKSVVQNSNNAPSVVPRALAAHMTTGPLPQHCNQTEDDSKAFGSKFNQVDTKCATTTHSHLVPNSPPHVNPTSISNHTHRPNERDSEASFVLAASSRRQRESTPPSQRRRRPSANKSTTSLRQLGRARSLSPVRSCPKLMHTQGRLDMDVAELHIGCDRAQGHCRGFNKCFEPPWLQTKQLTRRQYPSSTRSLATKTPASEAPTQRLAMYPCVSQCKSHCKIPVAPIPVHRQHHPTRQQAHPTSHNTHRLHLFSSPSDSHAGHNSESSRHQRIRRFKLFYRDESFRTNWSQNTLELIQTAQQTQTLGNQPKPTSPSTNCSSATVETSLSSDKSRFFALKALKYRRLWQRVERLELDLHTTSSARETCLMQCLGVEWCKVETT